MATLKEKRIVFSRAIAKLVQFADSIGIDLVFDEAKVFKTRPGNLLPASGLELYKNGQKVYPINSIKVRFFDKLHIDKSMHNDGLACDMIAYKDGEYLRDTEDYAELGKFWESLGGRWGGRFNDGNHFEWAPEMHDLKHTKKLQTMTIPRRGSFRGAMQEMKVSGVAVSVENQIKVRQPWYIAVFRSEWLWGVLGAIASFITKDVQWFFAGLGLAGGNNLAKQKPEYAGKAGWFFKLLDQIFSWYQKNKKQIQKSLER